MKSSIGEMQTAKNERRFARFRVNLKDLKEDSDKVHKIMQHVLVLHCEYDPSWNALKYECVSPLFDRVDEGTEPPIIHLKQTFEGLGFGRNWEFEFSAD